MLEWYPKVTYKNSDDGKEATEIQNRYFIMYNENSLSTDDGKRVTEERKWRKWVDDVYVHLLR